MNENLFIDYVLSFYGPNGIYASELDPPFTREECENALQKYLQIGIVDFEGDSIDRENLRDIVLISRGKEIQHLTAQLYRLLCLEQK